VRTPTRRELAALAVCAAALAGIVVLIAVYAPRWWSADGGSYSPPRLTTATDVAPVSALFADIVTFRAHVLVDRRVIDPARVGLDARFTPFRVVSHTRSVSSSGGHAARVDFAYRVQCLTVDCLGAAGRASKNGAVVSTSIRLRPAS
jgi:hypothetical protein